MKHRSPENHFIPAPRSGPKKSRARASKGETPLPEKSFHRSAWSARRKVNTTPFPPKRPKSPTGHPRALGKVPQSIPQWMFSESISDAFHPGDFPISPRITRGRSAAAGLRTTSGLRVVRARRKMKSPPPEKMWSARRKVKSPPPENHFPVPRGAAQRPEKIRGPRVER